MLTMQGKSHREYAANIDRGKQGPVALGHGQINYFELYIFIPNIFNFEFTFIMIVKKNIIHFNKYIIRGRRDDKI